MSLLALGALLEGEHDYEIVDGNLAEDPLGLLDRKVKAAGAGILGVTVMPGPQLNEAVPLCREMKRRHPGLVVVWGGYFPSQHHDACLSSGFVDFVVRGCGELAFKKLVDLLRQGGDPKEVPSLAFRPDPKGEIVVTPPGEVPDPDALPGYPYHRIDMSQYLRSSFLGSRTLSHHSSYGCPHRCSFCAVPGMTEGRWRAQSGRRLAEEVKGLVERFGADAVEFFDNSFFVDEARVADFAERIKPLRIGWWAEARIDTLAAYQEATWTLLRDSGLRMVFMGAESGSDETLKRMNKGGRASIDRTLFIAEKMKKYGIIPEFSFVLGNPPDAEADARNTLAFVRRLKAVNPAAEIILYLYAPVPQDGELYAEAEREGFRFPETLEEWVGPEWREFSERRNVKAPWLTGGLRGRIRDFECVLNAYYPTQTNPRLRGFRRALLRGMSAWRYWLRFYWFPLELKVLQKILSYRRPETSGL
jgi:radical SAM superfamily enzyme YgiQ (UPF0313 family)